MCVCVHGYFPYKIVNLHQNEILLIISVGFFYETNVLKFFIPLTPLALKIQMK